MYTTFVTSRTQGASRDGGALFKHGGPPPQRAPLTPSIERDYSPRLHARPKMLGDLQFTRSPGTHADFCSAALGSKSTAGLEGYFFVSSSRPKFPDFAPL
jgi:hypothetical protein